MTWQSFSFFDDMGIGKQKTQLESFQRNEQCFIRKEHRCGKIYGASKSCFIACPTTDEIEPILELMSEKLAKMGIEPNISVKERAYGQDIFCTKICGKIIESKFCIVILDDTVTKEQNIPNPNVYYEYGLMTSLRKHIIPLQKDDLELAFNIQSYDTIKYNNRNVGSELDRAIKDAVRITESQKKKEDKSVVSDKSIFRKFEVAGFELKVESWFLSEVVEDTNFKGFGEHNKNFYLYLARIDQQSEFQTILEDLDVILYRTEKKNQKITSDLEQHKKQIKAIKKTEDKKDHAILTSESYPLVRNLTSLERKIDDFQEKLSLMQTIYIGFIINEQLDRSDFIEGVNKLLKSYSRYQVSYNTDDEISFDEIHISLRTSKL